MLTPADKDRIRRENERARREAKVLDVLTIAAAAGAAVLLLWIAFFKRG